MNIFYPKTTRGLKSAMISEDEMGTVYFTESTAYSICSEGALYSTARYLDGSYDLDWEEVDFAEVEACNGTIHHQLITAIQDCLVVDAMNDPASGYYKNACGLRVA